MMFLWGDCDRQSGGLAPFYRRIMGGGGEVMDGEIHGYSSYCLWRCSGSPDRKGRGPIVISALHVRAGSLFQADKKQLISSVE